MHKRLSEVTSEKQKKLDYLTEAIRAYGRGFYIKNDYYNGINYAFLLNVRSKLVDDKSQAISDFVVARRVRNEVLQICECWLNKNLIPEDKKALNSYFKNWYWVKATQAEAYFGLDDKENAEKELAAAYEKAPEIWMKTTTKEQLEKLEILLQDSPLRYINQT